MKTEAVSYRHDTVELEGHLAYEPGAERRPVVLVVHEWRGLNDYAKNRAEQLAGLGYVGLAIDMYGQGVYAKDTNEAAQLMTPFVKDRQLCRGRITAAYATAKNLPQVDSSKMAAIS